MAQQPTPPTAGRSTHHATSLNNPSRSNSNSHTNNRGGGGGGGPGRGSYSGVTTASVAGPRTTPSTTTHATGVSGYPHRTLQQQQQMNTSAAAAAPTKTATTPPNYAAAMGIPSVGASSAPSVPSAPVPPVTNAWHTATTTLPSSSYATATGPPPPSQSGVAPAPRLSSLSAAAAAGVNASGAGFAAGSVAPTTTTTTAALAHAAPPPPPPPPPNQPPAQRPMPPVSSSSLQVAMQQQQQQQYMGMSQQQQVAPHNYYYQHQQWQQQQQQQQQMWQQQQQQIPQLQQGHIQQQHHANMYRGGYGSGGPPNRGGNSPYYPGMHQQQQQQHHSQQQQHMHGQQMPHQQQQQQQQLKQHQPPAVVIPKRKPVVITDKDGNVMDFSKAKVKASSSSSTTATTAASAASTTAALTPAAVVEKKLSAEDAGAKLYRAALERKNGDDAAKTTALRKKLDAETDDTASKEAVETATKVAEEKEAKAVEAKATKEAEEKAAEEAKEMATKEAAEKAAKEAEEIAAKEIAKEKAASKAAQEEEEKASKDAADLLAGEAAEKSTNKEEPLKEAVAVPEKKSSLQALLSKPTAPAATDPSQRRVYTKEILLSLKGLPICKERPSSLPPMVVLLSRQESTGNKGRPGPGGGGGSGRRNSSQRGNIENSGGVGGGDQWARGGAPPRRQSSQTERSTSVTNVGGGGDQWSRGQEPPKQQAGQGNQKGRGRDNFHNQQPFYDGPVEPLVKSENNWRPRKNASALIIAEKGVKALLNKMTKEKFERLADQMLEMPILSSEIQKMMIEHVYDKAIYEPSFGEIYAGLCVRLSKAVQANSFVQIIDSDEEPPTDDGVATPVASGDETTSNSTVFRWSNDVSASDTEIIGTFASPEECIEAVFDSEVRAPIEREEMELELVRATIRRGFFIKVLKRKKAEDDTEPDVFYTVYFKVSDAAECGQQLSELFLSDVECRSDAVNKNSFKRALLNKCQEEFTKQDIYVDWKKDKEEYTASKGSLTDQERAEKEAELHFRRIRIKKQMLGNVKFIGQLYKVGLIKEKIMRYCIGSLLKLDERTDVKTKVPEYVDSGRTDLDEEDHEAICSIFATIGLNIDKPSAADFMQLCFEKVNQLILDKA